MIAEGPRVAARLAVVLAVYLGVIAGLPEVAAGEERQLFMFVMNQSGQPVLDLSTDELQVRLSDVECTVVSIHPETEGMKIALLVDNTLSAQNSLNALRDGLRAFLQTLPAGHEVGLFTIAGQTRRRVDFTPDREALVEQTDNLFVESGAGTVLLDGLVETWTRRFDEDDAWPVFVLVVYDGPEASSSVQEHEFNEFVLELIGRGATVHAILISNRGGNLQTNVSINITNNTGGVYNALAAATGLSRALTELATTMSAHYDEVKNRYRVVFECEPDDPQVPITVEVTRPAVGVRLFANRRATP